jgi:PKD repeat protein
MKTKGLGTLGAVWLALLAACVLVPSASAVVVHERNGHFLGVTPRKGISPASIPGSVAAQHAATGLSSNGNLNYNGGPVLHSSTPYLIFWTPTGASISSTSESLLERYFTDVATDSGKANDVYSVNRQFTDGSGFADYKQTFSSGSQAIIDTQPYPTSGNCTQTSGSYPTCMTDGQLQSEVQRLITANGLPTGTGSNAPIYFVVTPADVNVCFSDGTTCANNYFCAYHSSFNNGSDNVLYSSIPLLLATQNPKGCQSDGNSAVQKPNGDQVGDVAIKYMSHEDSEAITDPLGNAWWDTSSGNEDGDNCNFYGSFNPHGGSNPSAFAPTLGGSASAGTLYNQLINGNQYYPQSEWSNGDVNCELRPSAGSITPSFSVPSPGSTPVGQSVSFNPSGSTHTNTISSATWDFADGSTTFKSGGSSLAAASHSYAVAGKYTIKLTLVDDRGNLQSASQQITIGSAPVAAFSFTPSQPSVGSPVNFDGSGSSDPDSGISITDYTWDFGDGSTGTGAKPPHSYASVGTYTVKLTVTNSLGLTNATSQQVTVVGLTPAFTINNTHPAVGEQVSFDASASTDTSGTITNYAWSFGDGSSGTGVSAHHTYTGAGPYTVTLTLTDSNNQTNTVSHQLVVGSPPAAAFTVSPVQPLEGSAATFDGTESSDPDSGVAITAYSWDFGDGSSAGGWTPVHTYGNAGTYTVKLTVTNSLGLSNTTSQQLTVNDEQPVAGFVVRTAHPAANVPVVFDGSLSSDPDGSIPSYAWNFGDGSSAGSGATPSHTYKTAGTYTVTLKITDSSGLNASTTQAIVVVRGSRITKVSVRSNKKGKFLFVSVNGAGTLTIGARHFKVTRAKTVKFKVRLSKPQERKLARATTLKLKVPIKFTPLIGAPSTQRKTISFRR